MLYIIDEMYDFEEEYVLGEPFNRRKPGESVPMTPWKEQTVLCGVVRFICMAHKKFGNNEKTDKMIKTFLGKPSSTKTMENAYFYTRSQGSGGKGDDRICDFLIDKFNGPRKRLGRELIPYSNPNRRELDPNEFGYIPMKYSELVHDDEHHIRET